MATRGGHQNNAAATGGEPGGGIIMITGEHYYRYGRFHYKRHQRRALQKMTAPVVAEAQAAVLSWLTLGATYLRALISLQRRRWAVNETFLARHISGGGAGGGVIITSTPAAVTDVAGGIQGALQRN